MTLARRGRRLMRAAVTALRNPWAAPCPAPVFILGNQKTGSSAIAALLGRATGLRATIDLPGLCEPRLSELHGGAISLADLVARNRFDFSAPIVKEPALTFLAGELRALFPDARFAFIVRDPRDNLRSMLNRLGLPGDLPALSAPQLEGIGPTWRGIVSGRWQGAGAGYMDTLALRWALAAEVYLAAPEAMTLIRYEDFLADKVGAIAGLARALGLEPTLDIGRHVDVQYQPRGDRGASWRGFFGPRNLAAIEARCRPAMARFGYQASR